MRKYLKDFSDFFNLLAEKKSFLGGGSLLALNFCLAVALLEKILNAKLAEELKEKRKKAYRFISLDGEIFFKLLKEKDREKRLDLLDKLEKISFYLANTSCKILKKIERERKNIKKAIKVDFYLGAYLLKMVMKGSIKNIKINRKMFLFKKKRRDLIELERKLKELRWVRF